MAQCKVSVSLSRAWRTEPRGRTLFRRCDMIEERTHVKAIMSQSNSLHPLSKIVVKSKRKIKSGCAGDMKVAQEGKKTQPALST